MYGRPPGRVKPEPAFGHLFPAPYAVPVRSRLIAAAIAVIAVGILSMHGLGAAGTAAELDPGIPRGDARYGPAGPPSAHHHSSSAHAARTRHSPAAPVAAAEPSGAPAVPRPDTGDHGGLQRALGTCLWIVAAAAALRAAVRCGHIRRAAAAIHSSIRAGGAFLIEAGPAPPRLIPAWLVVSRR